MFFYDDSFHEWKLIPPQLMSDLFGGKCRFHSNLSFDNICINNFLKIYFLIGSNIHQATQKTIRVNIR